MRSPIALFIAMHASSCAAPERNVHSGGVDSIETSHDRHGLPTISPVRGRPISADQRWMISDAAASSELQNTRFGELEINEFWARKGWRLTQREERYLAEVEILLQRGAITPISRWSSCPYPRVYQSLDRVSVLGVSIDRGHEFVLEFDDDDDHLKIGEPRFGRTPEYQEDHEGGHGPATAR